MPFRYGSRGQGRAARPHGTPRPGSDAHGWCRRCPPAGRPSPAPGRSRRPVPQPLAPTAWIPSTRVVVGPGDDAHETLLRRLGQRAAIGGEGVMAELDLLGVARLGRRQADRDDLRAGEADRRDGHRLEAAAPAGDELATMAPCAMARCASIGPPATSPTAQTLRMEVAQRPSMRMKGPPWPGPAPPARSPWCRAGGPPRPASGIRGVRSRAAVHRPSTRSAAPSSSTAAPLGRGEDVDGEALHAAQHRPRQLVGSQAGRMR